MKIEHPLQLGRGQNDREHFMAKAKRVKSEKGVVGWLVRQFWQPPTPCTFLLTRISPVNATKRWVPLDDDNLAASWKAPRDAIAEWMGVDDSKRDIVRYVYRQEQGPWGIRIEVRNGIQALEA